MADLNTIGGLHYEMMRRCYNENSVAYKDYGAKGIVVCKEWHDRENFRKWAKENGWEKGLRLNRHDGKKNYCPGNCYFGTNMSKNANGYNQTAKRRIAENKRKKKEVGIIGRINEDVLYDTYISMHERCENSKHIGYKNYGIRGINVCKEWSGKDGFFNFKRWAIENGWIKGLTIDRIDNNKGYSPKNCRWITKLQQCYNKSNNILYSYGGNEIPLGMIAKLENVKYNLLYNRVRLKNMTINEAIADIKKSI